MNWYKHHLGDYDSHTSHLSWDEDLAYTRLLRAYYRRDGPIPETETYRLARTQTPEQRAAVDTVLSEFFKKTKDGWHNKRADVEISTYKAQCETNRRVGQLGGRPKTESVNLRNRIVSEMVPGNNPPQIPEPDTRKNLAQKCAFPECKKPGTRTRSTNGAGPWYCTDHADGTTAGPKHISDLSILPAQPKGKFDD